jgi:alkylation response protein AidB-like acyl-CoA dehydrogenase
MNFDFSDEQKLLKDHVARYLAAECPMREVRRVLDGELPYLAGVWQGLAGMGLMGTAIAERWGGSGAGYLELCVAAEELGRSLAPVPFGSTVYLVAEALQRYGSEAQRQHHLPAIASGSRIACLARAGAGAPASATSGRLYGLKQPVADGAIADLALVAAESARGPSLYLVDLADPKVRRASVESIDPTRNLARIVFDGAAAEPLGQAGAAAAMLADLDNRAAVLQSFEQLGVALRALEMAVQYAGDRYAFGRPIGSFQALKHMIVDMYVAAELARSNCYYAAWALSTDAPELPLAAATARVSATRAAQVCTRDNIQVHGGMGFTWQSDCHLYYRRANFQALELGSLSTWEDRLVDQLQAQAA